MKKLGLIISLSCALIILSAQENQDIFNIYFSHDFENNTIGNYLDNEWREDWNNPPWSDRIVPIDVIQNQDSVNGSKVLKWYFPQGGVGPRACGGQWLTDLGRDYDELYLSYKIKFKPGFEWVLGGKIHGLLGEPDNDGNAPPPYDGGFNILICWDETPGRNIKFYYYHQDQTHNYGDIYLWDQAIETDRWYTITLRAVMNTVNNGVGSNDGILEGFVDGKLVAQLGGIRFRNFDYIGINILEISTFYGGFEDYWAPKNDQWIETDDFYVFTYKEGINVPRGNTYSPKDRILVLPSGNITPAKIPVDTTPKIEVIAYGTELNSENAHFKLLVNNQYIGETYVTSIPQKYTFELDNEINENDTVYIVFDNDFFISGVGDRNLYVNSITANNTQYYPNTKNVVFVYNQDVLDGMDIQYGSNYLLWNGQLVFFLGENEVMLENVYPLFKEDEIANNPPSLENKSFLIPDNLQNGKTIGTIKATDPNIYQQLSYSIAGGNQNNSFAINTSDGNLYVNNSSGLQSVDIFNLMIEVKDNGPGTLSDTGLVTINVQHIDSTTLNNQPLISNQNFSLMENDLSDAAMQIVAFDPDNDQNLTYSILSGNENNAFYLNPISGMLTVNNASKIDFQNKTEIDLSIQVQDDGEGYLNSSATVTINLIPDIKVFYIDPQNINDPLEDGSFEHPYDSWTDISWEEGNSYLQKKGTTANQGKINIEANNVTLGAYGQGDIPVIKSSATDFALRAFEKSSVTIQNLKIIADEAISCIYFLGESCDKNIIEGW
jgi:hypothetical protein